MNQIVALFQGNARLTDSHFLLLLGLFRGHVLLDGVVQDRLDAERLHAVDAGLDPLLQGRENITFIQAEVGTVHISSDTLHILGGAAA